ncbi:prisilkin-39-like [Pseudomyrmex gracilis]|uniref:prisilkin-39-like n=1 Tax=Pseudomyrmex gracilis TaxID=219809 RepID=UPI00099529A7|nr:prisilkin-39-like [Pseudomyrmex gracilis]
MKCFTAVLLVALFAVAMAAEKESPKEAQPTETKAKRGLDAYGYSPYAYSGYSPYAYGAYSPYAYSAYSPYSAYGYGVPYGSYSPYAYSAYPYQRSPYLYH